MRNKYIDLAINKLGIAFDSLDLTFHQMDTGVPGDVTSYWPGDEDEDVLICVFKGKQIHEPFHRQDFSLSITHTETAIRHYQKNIIISSP